MLNPLHKTINPVYKSLKKVYIESCVREKKKKSLGASTSPCCAQTERWICGSSHLATTVPGAGLELHTVRCALVS